MFINGGRAGRGPRLQRGLPRLVSSSFLAALVILGLMVSINGCSEPPPFRSGPSQTTSKAVPSRPPSQSPSPPPPPPPSVDISSPTGVVHCTPSKPQCQFEVTGRATGSFTKGLEILVLVFPINPSGGGWYVQWPPATTSPSGAWLLSPAYIGSKTAAALDGDTLQIESVLVRAGASYNGTSLQHLSKAGMSIPDVNLITGLVEQSAPDMLTVRS